MGEGIQSSPIVLTDSNSTCEVLNMIAYLTFIYHRVLRLNNENGQTLAEYALILLLVAIVVATTLPRVTAALIPLYVSIAAAF